MKKLLLTLVPVLLLAACTAKKSAVPEGGEDDPQGEDTLQPSEDILSLTFKGESDRSGFTPGASVFNQSCQNALKALFGTYLDNNEDKGISGESCAFQYVGGEATHTTSMTIGSSSYGGNVTFNFNYDIYKVEYKIQNYYKAYSGGYTLDSGAYLYVEDKKEDLAFTDTTVAPPEKTGEYVYTERKKTLTFHNDGGNQRTYIHEFKITFAK